MSPSRPECALCGATGVKLTKEHIYGDWMSQVLPAELRLRTYRVRTGDSDWRASIQREKGSQTQLRDLCGTCNNVWGSQLEEDVQPIATPMILGRSTSLTRRQAQRLATWVAKIAVLRPYLDPPEHHVIPAEQRRHVRFMNEPPPHSQIWVGSLSRDSDLGRIGRQRTYQLWVPDVVHPDRVGKQANGHTTTLCFNRVVFMMIGCTEELMPLRLPLTDVFKLWPNPSAIDWSPTITVHDEDVAFFSGLPTEEAPFAFLN